MDYEAIFQDMLRAVGTDALDLDDKESIVQAVYHPDKDVMRDRIQATIHCGILWIKDVLDTLEGLQRVYKDLEG